MHKALACIAILILLYVLVTLESVTRSPIQVSYNDLTSQAKHQVDCIAENIYFEARSEPIDGQKAVAFVTMNRVKSSKFPRDACSVVRERQRTICQFTWWCEKKPQAMLASNLGADPKYRQALLIAMEVYLNHGRIPDVTKGALFYHADYVAKHKIGVPNLQLTAKIGRHIFYKA